jgi:Hint domain
MMKPSGFIDARRQLLKIMAAGAASVPFLALTSTSTSAQRGRPSGVPGGPPSGVPRGTPSGVRLGTSCLLKGTRISTASGDRPVQELQIGEDVHTLDGLKTIKWIGYNKFTKEEGTAWQDSVMPVRVARFALDDHTPQHDLYLSQRHYIYFNNVLIPVMYLINQATIIRQMSSDISEIEYYHLDLGTHEVIYAEGTPVDSFFDDGSNRENFSNFVQYERLYGSERQSQMIPFAPMLGYRNRRQNISGLARYLISNVVDTRDPIQIAHDQIAKRAEASASPSCSRSG